MKCEICHTNTARDVHHIVSRACGGNNKPYNKASLCPNCHREVHLGQIVIEGRFQTTSGRQLVWRHSNQIKIIPQQTDPEVYQIK